MMNLKAKLRSRKFVFGSWLTLGNQSIAEIFTQEGSEWIAIDNEHSMMSLETIQGLILATQSGGASAWVRLSQNDASEIRKMLDAGADGLICPMINSRADAEKFVHAAKYPPQGKRTYGLSRAHKYGQNSVSYYEQANEITALIAQIEHVDAVTNLRDILAVKGIDSVLTGPYDLSGSVGLPGQVSHPKVIELEQKVITICQELGIGCGAHLVEPTVENIKKKISMGYTFLGLGTDFYYLARGTRESKRLALENGA